MTPAEKVTSGSSAVSSPINLPLGVPTTSYMGAGRYAAGFVAAAVVQGIDSLNGYTSVSPGHRPFCSHLALPVPSTPLHQHAYNRHTGSWCMPQTRAWPLSLSPPNVYDLPHGARVTTPMPGPILQKGGESYRSCAQQFPVWVDFYHSSRPRWVQKVQKGRVFTREMLH